MCYKPEQKEGLNLIQVRLAVPACSAFPWPSSSASLLPMADQLIGIPLVLSHISLSEVEPFSFSASYFYALLLLQPFLKIARAAHSLIADRFCTKLKTEPSCVISLHY